MSAQDPADEMMTGFLDYEAKIINYLLIANGAGLASVLATLKDYATTPQLHGLGKLVVTFGTGLMAAAIAFGLLQGIYIETRYLIGKSEVSSLRLRIMQWPENAALIFSTGCFFYAILTIMGALAHL